MNTTKPRGRKNPHAGSSLDDFLLEEGIFEEVEAAALKRALALKIADLMEKKQLPKAAMARDMQTSRAALNRLLDPDNSSVTLVTLTRAARALGRKLKIDLVPA